jgi:hypothetical protein
MHVSRSQITALIIQLLRLGLPKFGPRPRKLVAKLTLSKEARMVWDMILLKKFSRLDTLYCCDLARLIWILVFLG